jgi:hypothetical protein
MPTLPQSVSSYATASALLKRSSQVVLGETLQLKVDMQLPIGLAAMSSSLVDDYGRKALDLTVAPESPLPSCTVAVLSGATASLRPGHYSYEVKAVAGGASLFSGLYELSVLEPLVDSSNSALPPPSAGNSLTVGPYPAASTVNALRCVQLLSGQLAVCDGADPASFGRMVGLAVVSAGPGDLLAPVRSGLVSDSSWNWQLDLPVYVGAGGLLTQDLAGLAYIQIAGYPQSATSVYMDVEDAIRL